MRPPIQTLLLIGLLVYVPSFAQSSRDAAIGRAEAILKNLQTGNTSEVVREFNVRMAQELPEEKVKPVWPALVAQFGAFKSITERREGQVQGRQAVELILAFEKETIVNRVVFDAEGKLAGLVFRPMSNALLPTPK